MKKIISILYFACLILFFTFSQSSYNPNLLYTNVFSIEDYKNVNINITYENIEFSEIYGNEIVIDLYGNNNLLLPKIIADKVNSSITISSSTNGKKITSGDICKINIYFPKNVVFNNFILNFEKNISPINNIKSENIIIKDRSYSNNNSIELSDIEGNLKIISTNSNVNINNYTGEYLFIQTKNGKIKCTGLNADYFDIIGNSSLISVSLNKVPDGSSLISSTNGNIELYIPSIYDNIEIQENKADNQRPASNEPGFNLDIHSTKGTLFNKITKERFSPRQDYNKSFYGGGAPIYIKTISGNIEIDIY